MAYRPWRTTDEQAGAEAANPGAFGTADPWLTLADSASDLGAPREYSHDEWATYTGQSGLEPGTRIVAPAAWTLRPAYEDTRLEGLYVTLEGLERLRILRGELIAELRQARAPNEIRGLKLALYVITQAEQDPDRRRTFSQLIRDNDLTTTAFYRPAAAVAPGAPPLQPPPAYAPMVGPLIWRPEPLIPRAAQGVVRPAYTPSAAELEAAARTRAAREAETLAALAAQTAAYRPPAPVAAPAPARVIRPPRLTTTQAEAARPERITAHQVCGDADAAVGHASNYDPNRASRYPQYQNTWAATANTILATMVRPCPDTIGTIEATIARLLTAYGGSRTAVPIAIKPAIEFLTQAKTSGSTSYTPANTADQQRLLAGQWITVQDRRFRRL